MPDITSRPYRVNPDKACERCIFGSGQHANWCMYYEDQHYEDRYWNAMERLDAPYAHDAGIDRDG